jgi:NAD(P)-dependent dehydrogenase (short-subunit alcohol dehydrogenase family)
MKEKVCVVTGAGWGNGASLARRFAHGAYRVAMLARTEGRLRELERAIPGSRGYPTDVTDAQAIHDTFTRIRSELGTVDVLLHNAGSGAFGPLLEVTPEVFEASWRTNAYALLLLMRQVVPDMLDAARGAIIVTGATASLRGGANTAAFAAAKAAQRSLAQSAARSLGPKGIHVAYVIVDGVIDTPTTRALLPDQPDQFFLKPDAIAETVYHITHQDPSAWTFEVDIRPHVEKW